MTKKISFDVDMDFPDRSEILSKLNGITASIERKGKFEKHNSGVYFQAIPFDPETGLANIDHKEAEELGYFKIDFLNVSMYEKVKDNAHLEKLLDTEPMWELLLEEKFVSKLFHIGDYAKLVKQHRPTSVEQLSMLLAIIRPAKKHLQGKSWSDIEKDVWIKPTDGSFAFKRSHATSYAIAITVQMNLFVEHLLNDDTLDY